MSLTPRLGILIRTGSPADTQVCADLMGYTVIRSAKQLTPAARVMVDLDLLATCDAVEVGRRFRMYGAELVVAARPTDSVPHDLTRNLTGSSHG